MAVPIFKPVPAVIFVTVPVLFVLLFQFVISAAVIPAAAEPENTGSVSVYVVNTVPISTTPLLGLLDVPLIFTAVTVPVFVVYPLGLVELYGVYPRAEVIVFPVIP